MPPPRIVIIGCSHLTALLQAALSPDGQKIVIGGIPVGALSIHSTAIPPNAINPFPIERIIRGPDQSLDDFSPQIYEAIARIVTGATLVVSLIGGNTHNILSLVEHDRPFDFALEDEPSPPLLPGREIIPGRLFHAAMEAMDVYWLNVMRSLRHHYAGPLVHVESPPPIRDAGHIAKHAGPLADEIARRGVAPASLRYKAWRLHSKIYTLTMAELGGFILPAPPESQDADGFLLSSLTRNDPFHANEAYGALVAKQLALVIDRFVPKWKVA